MPKKRGSLAELHDMLAAAGYSYVESSRYARHPAGGGSSVLGDTVVYHKGQEKATMTLVELGLPSRSTGRRTGITRVYGGADTYELEGL